MSAGKDGGSSDDADDASSASSGGRGKKPTMQLFPLQLRFSQRKMRNVFADGKLIEDSAALVRAVRRSPEEAEVYDAAWRLEAPFPPIEVLRWRCKLRDEATGRPLIDARGREMFEQEESWFTLDNRRLYCLQKAALSLWPEHCTADVIAEVRKDRRMREIRKFRTLDNGQSIMVGSVVDGVPFERWDWRAEVAPGGGRGKGGSRKGGGPSKGGGGGGKGKGGKGGADGGKGGGKAGDSGGKGKGKDYGGYPAGGGGGGGCMHGAKGASEKGGGKYGKGKGKGAYDHGAAQDFAKGGGGKDFAKGGGKDFAKGGGGEQGGGEGGGGGGGGGKGRSAKGGGKGGKKGGGKKGPPPAES